MFTYDGFGRVMNKAVQIQTKSAAVGYVWGSSGTAKGKLVAVRYPSGNQVNYQYDAAGRIAGVTINPVNANGSGTSGTAVAVLGTVAYSPDGQLAGWIWANGAANPRTFDSYGRLSSFQLGVLGAGGVTRQLGYDAAGRIRTYTHSGTNSFAPSNQTFAYDNISRLKSQEFYFSTTYNYQFDSHGRLAYRTAGANVYAFQSSGGQTLPYSYQAGSPVTTYFTQRDALGNATNDGINTYAYSARGRMSSATTAQGTVAYLYNAFEQRVSKTGAPVGGGAAYYVYDESGHLVGEYDQNMSPVYETVYIGDTPVAVMKLTGSAADSTLQMTWSKAYADQTDTVRVVTVATDGQPVWRWDLAEAFGATAANEQANGSTVFKLQPKVPGAGV